MNAMATAAARDLWGTPPWRIDFTVPHETVPRSADCVVIGGGFTGLAAAAWLRRLAPGKSVVVLEAGRIGAGASGRTGGLVLAETAAGELPGLGDVLAGLADIVRTLSVDGDLSLPGAWEIARRGGLEKSPIEWHDSGTLRVAGEVPGGTLDPGKMVAGLARAAERLGAGIFESCPVVRVEKGDPIHVEFAAGGSSSPINRTIAAGSVLFATNALSLGLTGLAASAHPRLTLAVRAARLSEARLVAAGLADRRPFYTVDFPYLWGRLLRDNSIVFGSGLVTPPASGDVRDIDIAAEEPASMFDALERRIRGLHPAFASAIFTHHWGGPILFRDGWRPVFARHPDLPAAIVLGAYAGHGVALSTYLGAWAAEAILGKRDLPAWGAISQ